MASSPPGSPPLSPTSAACASTTTSSSSPDVRTLERQRKKENRRSLRERLVSSWTLHALTSPRSAVVDDASSKATAAAACVVPVDDDKDDDVNESHHDNSHSGHNNESASGRPFDGSRSAGAARGLRYKNADNDVWRSAPTVGGLPFSARRGTDAFRSEGHLVVGGRQTPATARADDQETSAAPSLTTTTAAAEAAAGQSKSGKWSTKKFTKTLMKVAGKKSKSRSEEEVMAAKAIKKTKKKDLLRGGGEDDLRAAEVEAQEKDSAESIHVLIKRGDVEAVAKLLSRKGKRSNTDVVNAKNALGSTPLHTAVETDNLEMVRLLLQNGANADIVDGIGWSPLLVACKAGNVAIAHALLVEGNADANSKTNDLNTPLHYLAGKAPKAETRELYFEVLTTLLGKEGKVYGMVSNNTTARNKNGDTPLHYAALHGKPEVVRWLLEHHASVNNQNSYGDTALHCAVMRGDVEIVQILLKSGASKSLSGRSGTPREIVHNEFPDNADLRALF